MGYNLSKELNDEDADNAINPAAKAAEGFEKLLLQTKVKIVVLEKILKELGSRSSNPVAQTKHASLTKAEEDELSGQLQTEVLEEVYETLESENQFDQPTLELVKERLSSFGYKDLNQRSDRNWIRFATTP
jgi:predicted house-cleaning noncanonical NTP pyrophosphatase (MazG superfamily)